VHGEQAAKQEQQHRWLDPDQRLQPGNLDGSGGGAGLQLREQPLPALEAARVAVDSASGCSRGTAVATASDPRATLALATARSAPTSTASDASNSATSWASRCGLADASAKPKSSSHGAPS
jgi:hypothetical protein